MRSVFKHNTKNRHQSNRYFYLLCTINKWVTACKNGFYIGIVFILIHLVTSVTIIEHDFHSKYSTLSVKIVSTIFLEINVCAFDDGCVIWRNIYGWLSVYFVTFLFIGNWMSLSRFFVRGNRVSYIRFVLSFTQYIFPTYFLFIVYK